MKSLISCNDTELSLTVFNTSEYYFTLMDNGLLSLVNQLNSDGILYTPNQFDMLCRDYQDQYEEMAELKAIAEGSTQ
tara:strand:+ start:810 stop:1040 length:231 start_codon:yes stop_codon:yes gene_type:complete